MMLVTLQFATQAMFSCLFSQSANLHKSQSVSQPDSRLAQTLASNAKMEQLGIFRVAEMLKQPIDEKCFGEVLLRGIRWFSHAQIQVVKENEYLNLINCLETFLTPSDPNEKISNAIAEGVAFVLSNDQKERKQLKQKIKDLYNKRSRVAHGGRGVISTSDLQVLKKITANFLTQMIQRMDEFHIRKDLDEWIENQKFA